MRAYESPQIKELGSLQDLTLQSYNKVGGTPDVYSAITNGVVIGSLVQYP